MLLGRVPGEISLNVGLGGHFVLNMLQHGPQIALGGRFWTPHEAKMGPNWVQNWFQEPPNPQNAP